MATVLAFASFDRKGSGCGSPCGADDATASAACAEDPLRRRLREPGTRASDLWRFLSARGHRPGTVQSAPEGYSLREEREPARPGRRHPTPGLGTWGRSARSASPDHSAWCCHCGCRSPGRRRGDAGKTGLSDPGITAPLRHGHPWSGGSSIRSLRASSMAGATPESRSPVPKRVHGCTEASMEPGTGTLVAAPARRSCWSTAACRSHQGRRCSPARTCEQWERPGCLPVEWKRRHSMEPPAAPCGATTHCSPAREPPTTKPAHERTAPSSNRGGSAPARMSPAATSLRPSRETCHPRADVPRASLCRLRTPGHVIKPKTAGSCEMLSTAYAPRIGRAWGFSGVDVVKRATNRNHQRNLPCRSISRH